MVNSNIILNQLSEILKNNKEVIIKSPIAFMDIHQLFYDCDNNIIDLCDCFQEERMLIDSINKILHDTSYYYEIDFTNNLIHIYQLNDTLEVHND